MRLGPRVVFDCENELEMADQIAACVDEIEIATTSGRDDCHLVLTGELSEDLVNFRNLNGLRLEEFPIQGVPIGAKGSNLLVGDPVMPYEIPTGPTGLHDREVTLLGELDPDASQYLPRCLEIPTLGVDEHTVVVPQEVSAIHVSLAAQQGLELRPVARILLPNARWINRNRLQSSQGGQYWRASSHMILLS